MNDQNTLSINILDKEYKIKCPQDKIAELQESALHLDEKMREIRQAGKVLSLDKIAIIAALNMAHELLLQKKHKNGYMDVMYKQLQDLQEKIEAALVE